MVSFFFFFFLYVMQLASSGFKATSEHNSWEQQVNKSSGLLTASLFLNDSSAGLVAQGFFYFFPCVFS